MSTSGGDGEAPLALLHGSVVGFGVRVQFLLTLSFVTALGFLVVQS